MSSTRAEDGGVAAPSLRSKPTDIAQAIRYDLSGLAGAPLYAVLDCSSELGNPPADLCRKPRWFPTIARYNIRPGDGAAKHSTSSPLGACLRRQSVKAKVTTVTVQRQGEWAHGICVHGAPLELELELEPLACRRASKYCTSGKYCVSRTPSQVQIQSADIKRYVYIRQAAQSKASALERSGDRLHNLCPTGLRVMIIQVVKPSVEFFTASTALPAQYSGGSALQQPYPARTHRTRTVHTPSSERPEDSTPSRGGTDRLPRSRKRALHASKEAIEVARLAQKHRASGRPGRPSGLSAPPDRL